MMFTVSKARNMPILFLLCEMDEEACFCSFFPIIVNGSRKDAGENFGNWPPIYSGICSLEHQSLIFSDSLRVAIRTPLSNGLSK